jgi:hypothetical protein
MCPLALLLKFLYNAENARVAQLAEQLIRNQQVVGSIPTAGLLKCMPL